MADLVIGSLRGGANNTDPAIALPDDQCVSATNVEWVDSMLGERRKGTDAITLPAGIAAEAQVSFLYRHLPTSDATAAELWAMGHTGTSTIALAKKTSSWATVTISDTPNLSGFAPFRWQAQMLHGKLFLAYDSDQDRLHVWDGTSLRRAGLKAPTAAPTGADTGGVGTLTGTRYYRIRYTVMSGSTVLRRSEPSAVLTHAPSGTNASITITKPSSISESETHWELEASVDNALFYVLATTAVGTTTVVDTTVFGTGYSAGVLSEDIEDYALIPSAKYLSHDEDRLIWAGSWETAAHDSRVGWTPVFGADGVGNDERFETDTDPFKDLDAGEGGPITGLSQPMMGGIYVFKISAIYKLTRSGKRQAAYDADKYSTDAIGAVHGSVVSAVDAMGRPCVYFLDPETGPCRVGAGGIMRCGEDLRNTWQALNVDAAKVLCASLYYPAKKQVIWTIAVDSGDTPTVGIVLHVDKSREFADGVRKGWSVWTGNRAKALTMCLFSDNIEANTTRSNDLVPFIGLVGLGLVHQCDTGIDDNGVAYAASITTKPYVKGTILHQFEAKSGALLAKADADADVTVSVIRDFGVETPSTVSDISLAPTGSETQVVKTLDDLNGAELHTLQFTIADVASPAARWEINQLAVREEDGQRA